MSLPRKELQTGETDSILDTIDKLRSLGIGSILELPQIIVCGDQSSGKSSVLNAVSTLKFPTKDGLCTRFATEVIMRPGSPEHIVVSIVAGAGRSAEERGNLDRFRRSNIDMEDIESIISEATAVMGIDPENSYSRRFSDDILRFEVTGPEQPSLTLVDLPGLFQAPSRYQTKEDTESVQDLVLRYMQNKRSVILAVISAKSDFVLQSVTKYSREVDPLGRRTLGIITKPDKLDPGSDSEKQFIELAENRLSNLHRGWHVLVNRDHNTREYSQNQRDDSEKQFLSRGMWSRLPINHKGVFTLRSRLSNLLRDHILEGLPELVEETEDEIRRCDESLSKLGVSRATSEDRRRYLMQAAQTYSVIMRSCINGSYDDKFFYTGEADVNKQKRLRAVVQNTLMQYSKDMQQIGHAKHIIEDTGVKEKESHQHPVTQTRFEDEVIELMKHDRGRELMGMHNPMIVRELFLEQSKPWTKLTAEYKSRIIKAAKTTISLVLQYATDENTIQKLEKEVIKPSLEKMLDSLDDMIQRLLRPRLESHPITYNRRLAENIAKAKQAFAEKVFAEKYERAINTHGQVVPKDTLKFLFQESPLVPPADLARFAASEAIDVMRAYYKIAKETLVDNFSSLAIEDCLISQMPDIFCAEVIADLDDDTIAEIAMETDSAAWERSQADNRLELCKSALEKLKLIESMRAPGFRNAIEHSLTSSPEFEIVNNAEYLDAPLASSLSQLDMGLSDQQDARTLPSEAAEGSTESQMVQRKKVKNIIKTFN